MPLSSNSYGTVAGTAAYCGHMLTGGTFTASTKPTLTQVEGFLDQMSARLNGWLAQAGYNYPISNSTGFLILSNFANLGAAGLCELVQASGGWDANDENRRENKFLAEFEKAEAYIKSGALAAVGAPQDNAGGPLFGLSVGGRTRGAGRLQPIFTRTGFGNQPTVENGVLESDTERS
jgi:hypothetical protein